MSPDRRPSSAEDVWRKYDAVESRLTAGLSERMLDLAGIQPGMRVLDLASGRGEPAIRAARRVGLKGQVFGVDLSDSLLEMAREKAALESLTNLEFRAMNAERLEGVPTAHFHAATVRWGLMYMASPIAALVSARQALIAGGALVAAVWAEPERVPYFTLPRRLLEPYRTIPAIDPQAPGTFRYADPASIARDFTRAGFKIEHLEELEVPVIELETGADLVTWARAFGLDALLSELPVLQQRAWEDRMTEEAERLRRGGLIQLGGMTRIVIARNLR